MTVPTGAILRASLRIQDPYGNDHVNVWYLQTSFAAPQTEQAVFDGVDAFMTASYGNIDNFMATGSVVLDMKLDVVAFQAGKWVVTQNVGFGQWGVALNPAETGEELPAGVAVLLKLRTALGKHYGRKFFGLMTELTNNTGLVSSALQTAVLALGSGILIPYTISAGNTVSVVVPDTASGIVRALTEVAVNAVWSYQRRRRQGVGG